MWEMYKMDSSKKIKYDLKRVCKDCGYARGVSGYHIFHRGGTISFMVSNLEDTCPMCANKEVEL